MGKFTGHPITDDSTLGGSVIERSLRIDQGTADSDSGSNYSRTFASGNRKTFTISVWVKKCNTPGNIGDDIYTIISCGGGGTGSYAGNLRFNTSDQLIWSVNNPAPSTHADLTTNRKFRDPSAWYHIVFVADTTQGTASNRLKLYVNGVQETDFASTTYPSQNYDLYFNLNVQHRIGSNSIWSDLSRTYGNFNGYFAEFHFLDGTAYDPSYFGYTESQTGLWRPKKYTSGNYGTNGFYLDFIDNTSTTTLGLDKSGQGNNFTPEDVSVGDCVRDTPSNNFSTLNKLSSGLSWANINEGNLRLSSGYGAWTPVSSSMVMSSGKWYWEVYVENIGTYSMFGIIPTVREDGTVNHNNDHYPGTRTDEWGYHGNGSLHNSASPTNSWGATYTTGDIISFALDMDEGKLNIYKNGSATGSQITGISATNKSSGSRGEYRVNLCPYGTSAKSVINFGQDGTFAGNKTSQGNTDASGLGDFYYSAPAGYKALCSKNLPPNVPSIIRPQKFFDSVLWTGNGGTSQTVTGLEFKPDFVWIKGRSNSAWHRLQNSVVGANKLLYSNSANAEATNEVNGYVSEFTKDGFKLADPDSNGGGVNQNSATYVAWCWKSGGAAVSNSDGAITSSVSVNDEAGFSIVSYSGDGNSTSTIGHGLSKAPKWIITKCRSTSTHADWVVWHEGLSDNKNVYLNQNNAEATPSYGHITDPTSTLINVSKGSGNQTNASGETYISYCWTDVPGYSKFGSYKGNGNSDGIFVNLGFRAAFIMIKSSSLETNWNITTADIDGYNVVTKYLDANTNSAEGTYTFLDILSNGFKARNVGNSFNQSGASYIYMAFAEQPGTTSFDTFPNAR